MSTMIVDPITNRTERHDTLLRMLYDLLASEKPVKAAIGYGHIDLDRAKAVTELLRGAIQEPLVHGADASERDAARTILEVFLKTRPMRQVVARHMVLNKRCPRVFRMKAVRELKELCEDIVGGEVRH